ncbi:MAG TPA: hypothetical protein ENI27_00945 [bacterium]|nr:hypothetical protein [bacterium]
MNTEQKIEKMFIWNYIQLALLIPLVISATIWSVNGHWITWVVVVILWLAAILREYHYYRQL